LKDNRLKKIITQHKNDLENLILSLSEIKPHIACIGLLNAGKSTLLNTLIEDMENQTFLTADIRETAESKMTLHKNIYYIDTPGLDATKEDTQVVMNALKGVDIILFVHNINTGEFDPSEFDFLKLILKNWNDHKNFIDQSIFVLSKIDAMNAEDEKTEIESTSEKIISQIYTLFNCKPTVVSVAAESYQEGIRENEVLLQEYSNILLLKNTIEHLINRKMKTIYDNKLRRIDTKFQEVNNFLKNEENKLKKEREALYEKYKNQKNGFVKEVVQLNKVLQLKKDIYDKL